MSVIERERLEELLVRSAQSRGRASQLRRVNGIEDYLFIRGGEMSAEAAAARLGVNVRTVNRWRATLRAIAGSVR